MPCTKCKEGKYKWGETGDCKYDSKEDCESANHKYNKMRPTPLGKTYEEYAKELKEFNLSSSKRIDLGLTDDAKTVVKEGKAIQKKMAAEYKVWPKIEGEYGKVFGKILDFLDNTKGLTTKAEAIQKQANSIFDKLEKSAKELGININDIPVAKQLDEVAVDLTDNITDIENARRQAKDA
jgi:hypothetical protein